MADAPDSRSLIDSAWHALRARHPAESKAALAQAVQEESSPLGPTPEQKSAIEAALRETYFAASTPEHLQSDEGRRILADHVDYRFRQTATCIVPWILGVRDLADATVVELGCGTGSSTAALAPHVRHIEAFEICGTSADAARRRLEILDISNAAIHTVRPDQTVAKIQALSGPGDQVEVVLLYAVLEHMTIDERVTTIRSAAEVLAPGGLVVVVETPNRLTYFDAHTSHLPFFQMLPDELAVLYAQHSPRSSFAESIQRAFQHSPNHAIQERIRSGTGVSFHEFEAAVGTTVHDCVVRSGYEPEIQALCPITREEALLALYLDAETIQVHEAFARNHLNLILQKPR